ncbi:peptidylprolyl isomerase [Ancylobacter defluvii]|uniref:Parvulin-like PPIase n=1 Tax=Ancylobacter defluvii TaxID=1282440 RepID=A0A9W6JRL7_9HYPH|nr:peptidylprolyl isomerase [Ancylobacter defluvii]MBS7587323.1 peptidylprolyl isomerase [Ancylobacter defluvii]GLK82012.1 peptidylprolyl isomerase [Ancylobacter defluvii]
MTPTRPHATKAPIRARALMGAGALALILGAALVLPGAPVQAQTAPAAPAQAAPAQAAPAQAAPAQAADTVLATVNGTAITRADVTAAAVELGPNLPPQIQGPARDEYVLGFLIDLTAMAQAAEVQKLDETEDFKRQLDFIKKRVLMQAALEQAAKAAVTDEALKKTYEEALKQQKPEEEVHARHILFRADANDKAASEAAEKKAKDVEARLKKGEDFAKLASELTEDPSGKQDGGDLGFFTKDQMVPEFAEKAFSMKPGDISEPVKTQFGWHVIKVEEKRQKPLPTFDEVRPQIEQYLVQKAQADAVQKTRDAAKVEKTAAAPKPSDLTTQPAAPAEAPKPAQ